ncbi:MetQ/NlpA family ABC transporter substrate-binding protein [Enterococcus saccharolyticus]|uniref:MetQ/NlpA family ABC transporter substrate-binding protein n=1 Tax=Enterococcus saccharolyticus TaxID=41997 RepID=UPI001E3F00B6|nr:MetQ/NlpA family ABC transporter substrate-binding protein [Enterococcus saccharolyticus]MCD5002543.1 MetQ/NlpA family ABC transporter substrate-binding protein [Enterococcus saccharolyticus]
MKKFKKVLSLGFLGAVFLGLAACSSGNSSSDSSSEAEKEVITVGASATPHAEILEQVKDQMADKGYDLKIKVFDDYVIPNTALNDGDLDANFFQHLPYLENFNEEHGMDLVSVGGIHFEPLGIYPGKVDSLDDISKGGEVSIPNDATNGARALLLLEEAGLIKLKDDADITATTKDIVENPKDLKIVELDASQIARAIQDVDVAVINANYALEADFNVETDALLNEDKESKAAQTYANIIAVKPEDKDSEAIKALLEALQSDEVRDFINDNYKGAVVPLF